MKKSVLMADFFYFCTNKLSMLNNNAKYVFVAFLIAIINVSSAFFVIYYISKINFYDEFKIKITENNLNLTSDFNCYGITFTGNKIQLQNVDSVFIHNGSWYFSEIVFKNKSKKNIESEILIVSQKNEFTIKQDFANQQSIRISKNPKDGNFWDKVTKSGLLQAEYTKLAISIIILLACVIVICSLIIVKKPAVSIFIITSTISFFILLLVELLIKSHPGIWTGVWVNLVILSLFFSLLLIRRKRHNKLTNAILFLSALIFAITIAEICLRLFHINYSYSESRFGYYKSIFDQKIITNNSFYEPNSIHYLEAKEFYYKRATNTLGLSDKEPKQFKEANDYIIIGLGDSFTEGDGAHSDSTWLKFLEMNMPDTDSINYEWINAGICGSDPFYEYKLLKDKLLSYNPDLVIINYGNDLDDIIFRGGMERFDTKEIAINKKIWEPVYIFSFLYRTIIHEICGYNYLLLSKSEYEQEKQRAINQLKVSLLNFKKLSEEYNFELLIVFHPMIKDIDENRYKDNCFDQLINFSVENNINYIDLLKYYCEVENISSKNSQNYYWVYDGHHNAAGYEKFANGVHWKLKQMGL